MTTLRNLALAASILGGVLLTWLVLNSNPAAATPVSAGVPSVDDAAVVVLAEGNMSAMDLPATTADRDLAHAAADEMSALLSPTADEMDYGAPVPDSVRILLQPEDAGDALIYAFRTDSGKTCISLRGQSGGCMSSFPASKITWVLLNGGPSSGGLVWGAAADAVTSIDAVTPTGRYSLRVQRNAFYGKLPAKDATRAFVLKVSYADGSSMEVPVSGAPARPKAP